MRGERTVKRPSSGHFMRVRLTDITNSPVRAGFDGEIKPFEDSAVAHDHHVKRLLEENMALTQVLEERNKAIELNVAELQKLRVTNQKMQLQNWNLAQSNSQMLAELKVGRERMKTLEHELVCKQVLLKAKNLEIKRKAEGNHPEINPTTTEVARGVSNKPNDAAKHHNHARRHGPKTMVAFNSNYLDTEKETVETKRRCVRRYSGKFGLRELKQMPNSEPADETMQEAALTPRQPWLSKNTEGREAGNNDGGVKAGAQCGGRSSLGRPLRRVAERVQSYKEIPINAKMRRST